ncbi:MAG: hypothetical protein GY856_43015 [bacterium]|nr:hypothetical protein [bacterium]
MKKVKLGKKTIYDDQLPPPTTTIDSGWKGGSKDREIKSDKAEELKFEFVDDAVPGSFVSDAP